jgi:ribonuclease P protein component
MRRHQRLRRRQDFAAVYRKGRPVNGELLAIRALRNDRDHCRFGFAVNKRVGKAVVRNRVKRRLRAAATALAPAGGWDVVVTARAPAAAVTYDELVRALAALFTRARILPAATRDRG